jgi:hypothetical protein
MILRMLSLGVRNLPIAHLSAYRLAYVPEQTKNLACLNVYKKFIGTRAWWTHIEASRVVRGDGGQGEVVPLLHCECLIDSKLPTSEFVPKVQQWRT